MDSLPESLLRPRYIILLAKAISCGEMKAIVKGYLDISYEVVVSLVDANRDDMDTISQKLIRKWAYKHLGENQMEKMSPFLKKDKSHHWQT